MNYIQDFINEINLIEKHMNLRNFLTSNDNDTGPDFNLGLSLIMDYQVLIYKIEFESYIPDEDDYYLIKNVEKLIDKAKIFKKTSQVIDVKKNTGKEDEYEYVVSNVPLLHFMSKQFNKGDNETMDDEVQIIFRNTLYNLCTITEKYFGIIYKDYLMNHHGKVNFKDELLTFEELSKIGNIEESQKYLIDRRLSKLFVNSVSKWSDDIFKELNIKKNTIDEDGSLFSKLDEMYNLRNLFIHGDGIVNDMFLLKTKEYKHIAKGERIKLTVEQISNFKNNIFDLMMLLFYNYGNKIYKNDNEKFSDFISELNNTLLKKIKEKQNSILQIYELLESNPKVEKFHKHMFEVNRYIYYYHHDKSHLNHCLNQYDTEYLSEDFKLAKAILTEDKNNIIDLLSEIISNDEIKLFVIHEWPLIRIATNKFPEIKDMLNERLNDILTMGDDNMPINTKKDDNIKVSSAIEEE